MDMKKKIFMQNLEIKDYIIIVLCIIILFFMFGGNNRFYKDKNNTKIYNAKNSICDSYDAHLENSSKEYFTTKFSPKVKTKFFKVTIICEED